MYTRCSHCGTVFRVTGQQLKAGGGQVQCGQCERQFDAFATLTSRPPATVPGTPPPAVAAPIAAPAPPPASAAAMAEGRDPADSAPAPDTTPAGDPAPPPGAPPPGAPPPAPAEPALALPADLFGPRRPAARAPWAAGSALLALLLLVQGAWFHATTVALQLPALRPALEAFCAATRCHLGYARLPDQLAIDASDLQVVDPAQPGRVLLTASIRNRADFPQELPLLELTLSGAGGASMRRVLLPAEYVDGALWVPARGALAPNEELPVRVYLDAGTLQPSDYRLYLFFG